MSVFTLQANMTRGELTPYVHARGDTDHYQAGLHYARNVVVLRYGGVTRVPGTKFDGLTKNANKKSRFIPFEFNRTQVEVTYDRSFVPSWNFGGTSTNEELRTSAFFPITNRLSVNLGVSYSRNDPIISSGDLLGLNSWWTSSSVGYAAARWLRIEGFFNGSFQDSTARGEVNRRRIGIQIVTSKPVRIQ